MPFQTVVNLQQAPAIAGDFASSNPRASTIAPESGFVVGTGGVTVGRFAWVQADGVSVLNSGGRGKPDGFVHREEQALITAYLGEASNLVQQGYPIGLMRTGDYWVTATVSSAVVREKAFAKYQDGTVRFEPTGTVIQSAAFTAAQTATTLTVSAVSSGTLLVGDLVTQASGTPAYVVSQLTGTPGGVGTYQMSVSQTVGSGAATSTSYAETDFFCSQPAAVGELAVMTA